MKKLTLLFALSLFWNLSMSQSDRNWRIGNYTNPVEIEFLASTEVNGEMRKVGAIFSKARGVTTIAAINNVNNRALRKLKTEASMRGGSHILVTQESQENNILSKTTAYTAIVYNSQKLDIDEIKNLLEAKDYTYKFERKYNRNKFNPQDNTINYPLQKQQWNPPYEKKGKIFIQINEFENNRNRLITYEIVAYSDSQILLFVEDVPGKEMRMVSLEANK
jgi:hypothetical protein